MLGYKKENIKSPKEISKRGKELVSDEIEKKASQNLQKLKVVNR